MKTGENGSFTVQEKEEEDGKRTMRRPAIATKVMTI